VEVLSPAEAQTRPEEPVRSAFPGGEELAALVLATVVAAGFYLAPWGFVYLPLLLALAALTWWRPQLTLGAVLVFSPFFMLPKHFGGEEFAPSEIFLVLTVAIVGLQMLIWPVQIRPAIDRVRRSPFMLPLILFFAAATLSTALAADRHVALRAWREVIAEPALFFVLLLVVLRKASQWWLMVVALVSAGVLQGVIGLIQLAAHHDLAQTTGTSLERITSVYGSPDNLGLLFDRVIPLWLAVLLLAGLATRWRLLWLAAAPILGLALLFTWSRGAWVATAAACLLIVALTLRRGRWIALLCLVLLAGVVAVDGARVVQAFRSGHTHTVQQRVDIWRSSLKMVRKHPLVGVGPDNFLHYYAPQRAPGAPWYNPCKPGLGYVEPDALAEPCTSHPHDELLDFWLSTGLLGLIAFLWLEVRFWLVATTFWRRLRSSTEAALVLGAMAAMAAILVHGTVDNSYFLMDLALIFWFLFGLMSFLTSESPFRLRG
jgi:O-antigen ligase